MVMKYAVLGNNYTIPLLPNGEDKNKNRSSPIGRSAIMV